MNNFGKGGLLGASILPATSVLFVWNQASFLVLIGTILISLISIVITVSYITRYFSNRVK